MKPAVVFSVACTVLSVLAAPAPAPSPTGIPSTSSAQKLLAALTVVAGGDVAGYARDNFKTWDTINGTCNTRYAPLKRDGKNVVVDGACEATSGTWVSPYDGKTWTSRSDLQIDHMVPLKNAWNNGASDWTASQREAYANDIMQPLLWAVTSSVNESKGDRGPDEWKPPSEGFYCTYAEAWVEVKSHYKLTVTADEKSALSDMLGTC